MSQSKIRRCFAVAAIAACFAASTASAAMLATNDFETSFSEFTSDGVSRDELAVLTGYDNDRPSSASANELYPFGGFGDKYLAVDSDTNMLWRAFDTRSASTYFDSYVKFSPMYGDFEYPSDSKFLIYLDSETNLCVISGTAADNRAPVTNTLANANVEPDSWGRLTVRAISGSVFSFQVLLNGTLLKTANNTDTFYSLTADQTLSTVGVSGTGALENFAVRTTDPYQSSPAATIGSESYATLEQALDEANGATVTLDADHAGTAAVTKSGTYVVDKGSYTFGGVIGTEGSYVSSSTSGNVDTYTVKLLVAMWDGATGAYDFSTLTRTVGDNTYTLNLNSQNTVEDNGSYVQIGPNNAQKGVVLTVQNLNPTVTNGFGTAGAVTVLMKCSDIQSSNANRLLIGILDSGRYENDNSVKIGLGTRSDWGGAIFEWQGVYHSQINQAISSDEQTVALTYNSNDGTAFFVNGERKGLNSGLKSMFFTTPCGISLGGSDSDSGSKFYAMSSMTISAIAVFSSTLTADEVASYTFPSETPMSGTVTVSDINTLFGTKSEITVRLADGTTVTGDTTFNASTVNFVCDGSFTMTAPAGNTATFDFSGVTGNPVFVYNGVTPSVSESTFTSSSIPTWVTDSTKWTGTVWIKNVPINNFNPSNFGNAASTLRLSGISAYFPNQTTQLVINPAIELVNDAYNYGLYVSDGFSRDANTPNRYITFSKLKGDGELWTGNNAPNVLMNILDWSDFSGKIQLVNKIVVFGSEVPAIGNFNTSGSIYIPSGVTVTVPAGKQWRADGGVHIHGTFKATDIGENQLRNTTTNFTYDTGTFVLTSTGDGQETETDTSYDRITGTGTLKYEGTGWRALSVSNFPTNMTLMNEQAGDILLSRAQTYTVGSFAGSKNLQGNYGSGDRYLRVLQAKDTEWSGIITYDYYTRFKGLTVAPGVSTSGTLTLAGTQTQSATLTVVSGASVNLTGTWKGATTVAGTIGGTGTIDGDLTLSDGATLKVDSSPLTVKNSLTVNGTISIDLPEGAAAGDRILTTTGGKPTAPENPSIYVNGVLNTSLRVVATDEGLEIVRKAKGAKFEFH